MLNCLIFESSSTVIAASASPDECNPQKKKREKISGSVICLTCAFQSLSSLASMVGESINSMWSSSLRCLIGASSPLSMPSEFKILNSDGPLHFSAHPPQSSKRHQMCKKQQLRPNDAKEEEEIWGKCREWKRQNSIENLRKALIWSQN